MCIFVYILYIHLFIFHVFVYRAGSVTFGLFTGTFRDFSSAWYAAVGSSLVFTMCMYILSEQFVLLVTIGMQKLRQLYDQRINVYPYTSAAITHKDLQVELDQLYIRPEFPFEGHIASLLTLVFVCMTYSAPMPILNIICAISLFILYNLNKIFILRYHSVPTAYSVSLVKVVICVLYFSAILHCLVGIWAYGNNSFYAPNYSRY